MQTLVVDTNGIVTKSDLEIALANQTITIIKVESECGAVVLG